jgi:hypothetical protein
VNEVKWSGEWNKFLLLWARAKVKQNSGVRVSMEVAGEAARARRRRKVII